MTVQTHAVNTSNDGATQKASTTAGGKSDGAAHALRPATIHVRHTE